jgi:hypothetical protein
MAATITERTVHALEIVKEEEIAAPIDVVFETVLEQIGPKNEAPGVGPIPMSWKRGREADGIAIWETARDTSGATCRQSSRQHYSRSADLCLCSIPPSRTCRAGSAKSTALHG